MVPDVEGPSGGGVGHTFHFSTEQGDEPVVAVLEAVSSATGHDVVDLEPLSDVVDPDALNDLFDDPSGQAECYGSSDPSVPEVSFEYHGFAVTVSPGAVRVDPT